MFKFDFDIEDADTEVVVPELAARAPAPAVSRAPAQPCHSISLGDLIKLLPNDFSYTPISHPLGGTPILRRDLFDARFQLAQTGADEGPAEDEEELYIDSETDLIPGTYEGGLKSWEGGLDLVEVLARNVAGGAGEDGGKIAEWLRGSRVLEVGCGTGLPSAYILRALLNAPRPSTPARTTIHVQDYNLPVLSLVTLPNLVLAALEAIPEGARTAESAPEDGPRLEFDEADEDAYEENAENAENEDGGDAEEAFRPFDPTRAGTLDVTPELLDAFKALLEEHNVELLFTYGDWSGMAAQLAEQEGYNLVLTAETIYAEETVQPLVDVLRAATRAGFESNSKATQQTTGNLEDSLGALSVADEWAKHPLATSDPVILVAAKVLYFGVGGGLDSFLALVRLLGGWSSRVQDWVKGVGRAVVRVGW